MNALDGSATTGYYSGSALNGISIGHNTKIQESSDPTYYSGVAIGDYAQATGGLSFSLGNYAQSTNHLLWLLARLPYLVALTL